jgi:hypothetical protein
MAKTHIFLPALTSGQAELLDKRRLVSQLLNLERRTSRLGRDSVDHSPGGHDDVAKAAAGALVEALGQDVNFTYANFVIEKVAALGAETAVEVQAPVCPQCGSRGIAKSGPLMHCSHRAHEWRIEQRQSVDRPREKEKSQSVTFSDFRISINQSFDLQKMAEGCRGIVIWLILGPSGAGKSSFGQWLSTERNFLHLEIDPPAGDGIELNGLRSEWTEFFDNRGSAQDLREAVAMRLEKSNVDAVLTFSSLLVLPPDRIHAADQAGIRTIYFYGSAADCITAFLNRERLTARNLGIDHWFGSNIKTYFEISKPEYAPHRIRVFNDMGARKPHAEVFAELNAQQNT